MDPQPETTDKGFIIDTEENRNIVEETYKELKEKDGTDQEPSNQRSSKDAERSV